VAANGEGKDTHRPSKTWHEACGRRRTQETVMLVGPRSAPARALPVPSGNRPGAAGLESCRFGGEGPEACRQGLLRARRGSSGLVCVFCRNARAVPSSSETALPGLGNTKPGLAE